MVFSSLIFLWLFLPVVFVLNYIVKDKYSNLLLLIASLFFYAWGEPRFVFLMIISIIINWLVGNGICSLHKYKKVILSAGILLNLLLLGYYKYFDFGAEIVNSLTGRDMARASEIVLPIGISFFTFQAISYIIDVYRNDITERGGGQIN